MAVTASVSTTINYSPKMTITVEVSSLLRTRRSKEINYLGPVEEFLAIQL